MPVMTRTETFAETPANLPCQTRYEYKVVPAPEQGKKGKGIKTAKGRQAFALESLMNELGADGWEYMRADTLPFTERVGLTGRTTSYQNMLVFRRVIAVAPGNGWTAPAETDPAQTVAPLQLEAPTARASGRPVPVALHANLAPVGAIRAAPEPVLRAPVADQTGAARAAAAQAAAALVAYRAPGRNTGHLPGPDIGKDAPHDGLAAE